MQETNSTAPVEGAATSAQEGKTFSQEDVNRIVSARLAQEKTKADAELVKKEQELAQRELLLTAKEKLTEKKLPLTLLDAMNASSPEALDKSISILEAAFAAATKTTVEIKGVTPYVSPTRAAAEAAGGAGAVRKAMGLK